MLKLVFGKGIYDIPPFIKLWTAMLQRCYSIKFLEKNPTYKGCTVCEEWLVLSKFWEWAEQHWKPGLHLDKDIIKPGNKVYCPEFCCFVPQALNKLLTDSRATRGKWPIGVHQSGKKFRASCRDGCTQKRFGTFDTPEEAHAVYVEFKANYIRGIAAEQTDPRIARGLEEHARLLEQQCHLNPKSS